MVVANGVRIVVRIVMEVVVGIIKVQSISNDSWRMKPVVNTRNVSICIG